MSEINVMNFKNIQKNVNISRKKGPIYKSKGPLLPIFWY